MMKFELSKVEGCGGLGGSRLTTSDKEVTKQDLVLKGGDRGACKLLGDVMVMLERKLKVLCHWANPFKYFERSNVPGIKLSSFSESDDTFMSLQALSKLHYLFNGFMDYFWSRKLNISNFGLAN
ncbi:hypothetical protein Tco_1486421, partial [Tanacetum coccineum]